MIKKHILITEIGKVVVYKKTKLAKVGIISFFDNYKLRNSIKSSKVIENKLPTSASSSMYKETFFSNSH